MDAAMKSVIDGLNGDVRAFLSTSEGKFAEVKERLLALEQRAASRTSGDDDLPDTLGKIIVDSEQFKSFATNGARHTGKLQIGSFHKTALVNAAGQNQPLVAPFRVPGVITPAQQRLTIRDLLPSSPTSSNLIEFCRESSFTNSAAMQGAGSSPQVYENVSKAESAIGFELRSAAVQTLAHWIPISRQLLDDATALQGYINNRLLYGLKLKDEDELLNGAGVGASLSGLITNATAYDTTDNVSGDTKIDTIRHALKQVALADYDADAIVLHPSDWETIELIKTTGSGIESGSYVISNPRIANMPNLWGKPVIPTKSIVQGTFLTGSFALAAMIWDRMQATVEISREHSDFFVKNMAAILCEERIALTVFNSDALIYGSFPA